MLERLCSLALVLSFTGLFATNSAAENEHREGGIIGTGIVGLVTELGSIHVNGQYIVFDETLMVENALAEMPANDLKIGHMVAVTAAPQAEDWRAVHIRQILPLVGPVSHVEGETVTIMGVDVIAPAQAGLSLAAGDWVAVSGFWQGNEVHATRIDTVAPDAQQARISGTFMGDVTPGEFRIAGARITGIIPEHLEKGDVVNVWGQPEKDGLNATRLETGLFAQMPQLIQVQGYYSPPTADGLYTILGSGMIAYTDQPGMIDPQTLTITCGTQDRLNLTHLQDETMKRFAVSTLGCPE